MVRQVVMDWDKYEAQKKARNAQRVVQEAVADGLITRPDRCTRCRAKASPFKNGRTNIEAHHADYSKPLDVAWLCRKCHSATHRALLQRQPEGAL